MPPPSLLKILIYEQYTSNLCELFKQMLTHLEMKDKKIAIFHQLLSGNDSDIKEKFEAISAAMNENSGEASPEADQLKSDGETEPKVVTEVDLIESEFQRIYNERKKSSEQFIEDLRSTKSRAGIVNYLDNKHQSIVSLDRKFQWKTKQIIIILNLQKNNLKQLKLKEEAMMSKPKKPQNSQITFD